MDDSEILTAVRALVDKEHTQRSRMGAGELEAADEQRQLSQLEDSLEQAGIRSANGARPSGSGTRR